MSVHAGQAKLKEAGKLMIAAWRSTQSQWRDDASRRFEDQYIEPMLVELRAGLEAMDQMRHAIDRVKRDCT